MDKHSLPVRSARSKSQHRHSSYSIVTDFDAFPIACSRAPRGMLVSLSRLDFSSTPSLPACWRLHLLVSMPPLGIMRRSLNSCSELSLCANFISSAYPGLCLSVRAVPLRVAALVEVPADSVIPRS